MVVTELLKQNGQRLIRQSGAPLLGAQGTPIWLRGDILEKTAERKKDLVSKT